MAGLKSSGRLGVLEKNRGESDCLFKKSSFIFIISFPEAFLNGRIGCDWVQSRLRRRKKRGLSLLGGGVIVLFKKTV